jgi:hypothetical protein
LAARLPFLPRASWPIPFFPQGRCVRWLRVNEANTRPLTVSELNASRLEGVLQGFHSPLFELVSSLKSRNGIDSDLRRSCKFPNAQAQSRARHPTLHWKKNHDHVLISVASPEFRVYLNRELNSEH